MHKRLAAAQQCDNVWVSKHANANQKLHNILMGRMDTVKSLDKSEYLKELKLVMAPLQLLFLLYIIRHCQQKGIL